MGIGDVKTVGGYAVVERGHRADTSLYVLAPGSTQATRLAAASPMMRVLGGALYFAQADGVYRWAPGEAVTKVGDGAPTAPWIPTYAGYDIAKAGDTVFWATPDAQYFRRLRTARRPGARPGARPVRRHARSARGASCSGPRTIATRPAPASTCGQADASGMRRLTDDHELPAPAERHALRHRLLRLRRGRRR